MDKIIVYGISNCDTIKKTLAWFKKNKIRVLFHDYKTAGITKERLSAWATKVGWEILLNKKSTTWRALPDLQQDKITNKTAAIKLMMGNTSIIKRPVIEFRNELIVGFNEEIFTKQIK